MNLINDTTINKGFYHLDEEENEDKNEDKNKKIDIYYEMNVDTIDYFIGTKKELTFVTKEIIEIIIEPFSDSYTKEGYGINGGDLIIVMVYNPIKKETWDKIDENDKKEVIRIFEKLKN